MNEFESLDCCSAYVAARDALDAAHRAASTWPAALATQVHEAAVDAIMLTAEAIGHEAGTAGRRRCLREALVSALGLAATLDVARAMSLPDDAAQRLAGRAIAMLGMFLHANAMPSFDEPIDLSTRR